MSPLQLFILKTLESDPTASYWLRNAVRTAFERDPVDVLADAQELVRLLERHLTQVFAQSLTQRSHNGSNEPSQ